MELSIFLAQLFGLYFIIVGVVFLFRRKSLLPFVNEFSKSHPVLFLIAILEILAGVAIAVSHPIMTSDWRGLITLIGYWMIVEGLLYLTLPTKTTRNIIRKFSRPNWYIGGSLIAIIIGLWLACAGFGFF